MPESDWKEKYRESLREMENEEKRWRQIEQALRRLIGRLCAAGMGVDLQLDDELAALAAANRRNADAAELERLAESLTTVVRAVDAVSPVPTIVIPPAPAPAAAPAKAVAARWDTTCAAAAKVLESLRSLNADDAVARDLMSKLTQVNSDAGLAAILHKTAELVRTRGATLALECAQAATVLTEVTARLAWRTADAETAQAVLALVGLLALSGPPGLQGIGRSRKGHPLSELVKLTPFFLDRDAVDVHVHVEEV